jgi:heterokaryon incompatibility protein (HET)
MPNVEPSGVYGSLPLKGNYDIRLLTILPDTGGPLACKLQVVDLETEPSYIALSYTWGPSSDEEAARGVSDEPLQSIICNNERIMITKNLEAFLLRARNYPNLCKRMIWIDAICIDQNEPTERTRQVNMMANIYGSAEKTIAWLGEEDEDISRGFDLIKALGKCCEDCLKKVIPQNQNVVEIREIIGQYADVSYWNSIVKVFQRRYFSRAWIIQEVTLPREVLAMSGSHTVDWAFIVKVSRIFTVTSWTRWICPEGGTENRNSRQSYHAIPTILNANKRARDEDNPNIMLYSLLRARRFIASDSRDKVYALLGVAEKFVKGKPGFSPIYGSQTPAATYTAAAIQILEDSDNLLLLAYAEGDKFRNIPSLPSWVPDWGWNQVLGLGVTGYERYAAAGQVTKILSINKKDLSLTVEGFKVDDIVSVGESKDEILHGKPFPQCLSILTSLPQTYHIDHTDHIDQPRSEVFWRVLITDTAGYRPRHPASPIYGPASFSWLAQKLARSESEQSRAVFKPISSVISNALKATPSFVDGGSIDDILSAFLQARDLGPDFEDLIDSSEYEATFSHARHLRLFMTSKGYLGVGSESLIEKDSIWIIAGCRVPLILREVSKSTFQIVGGAYLHGFMQGEALKPGLVFESLTII